MAAISTGFLFREKLTEIISMARLQEYFDNVLRRSRYLPKLINYGSTKELANIILAEWELRRQKPRCSRAPIST